MLVAQRRKYGMRQPAHRGNEGPVRRAKQRTVSRHARLADASICATRCDLAGLQAKFQSVLES